ncbi:flavodoxin family protein [Bacillus cereus]|uniref:flavodoxin family protein n=1 Tax=Bacillus cereus TaxID=1396 RepID=UPI0018792FD0|nr:flavodoxin family protein [Bacillus cereus]
MKNILAYVGSRNSTSRIYQLLANLIEEVTKKYGDELKIDFISPLNKQLYPSTGCKNCFNKGTCPSEKLDGDEAEEVKSLFEKADLIIIGSPVYSHNVSSDTKVLIDRLSYWAHIFKLAGKPSIVLTTAESNGAQFVTDYLEKVLSYMGAMVIHKEGFLNSEQELLGERMDHILKIIDTVLSGDLIVKGTPSQEATFQTLKLILSQYPEEHFEYKYWKMNNLFDCDTFEEVLKLKESNNSQFNHLHF